MTAIEAMSKSNFSFQRQDGEKYKKLQNLTVCAWEVTEQKD